MRKSKGAIIVGSIFQSILGLSGLMSFLLRLRNPVVVAPTVAAVGLAFSCRFPLAGSCMEVSLPQLVLVLIFTLLDYALNALMSLNIVVTLLVAFVLDNKA